MFYSTNSLDNYYYYLFKLEREKINRAYIVIKGRIVLYQC
jgi:hypothetical protein